MSFRYLTPKMRETIDDLAVAVRKKCLVDGELKLEELIRNSGIPIHESNKIIVPIAGHRMVDSYSFIGIPSGAPNYLRQYFLAHEFGHLFLGHSGSGKSIDVKEDETDYFAERVLDRRRPSGLSIGVWVGYNLLRNIDITGTILFAKILGFKRKEISTLLAGFTLSEVDRLKSGAA